MFANLLKTSEFWALAAVGVSAVGKKLGLLDHSLDGAQTATVVYAIWRVVSKGAKKLPI